MTIETITFPEEGAAAEVTLSVVIVSYNVCSHLRNALRALLTATADISCEVIVTDNNSSDGSAAMVVNEFPEVRVIASPVNEGFAAASNRAIKISQGRYILLLNPDTLVDPPSVGRAVAFMEAHPGAGAAGARMRDGNGQFLPESKRGFPSPATSLFRFTGLWRLFPRSPVINAYYAGNKPEDESSPVDILTGAFMLIRREALIKSGLLDTAFFMYGEDIDLSWRIRKAGYSNHYLHDVEIIHFKGRSSIQERERALNHFYVAMNIFTQKHLGKGWHRPVKMVVALMRRAAITREKIRQRKEKRAL